MWIFQSSRSLRTATFVSLFRSRSSIFQSSRSLRTATKDKFDYYWPVFAFQSSRSLRTATAFGFFLIPLEEISILAVLADRDRKLLCSHQQSLHFNPRGPCGPRRFNQWQYVRELLNFNPRGPCGPRRRPKRTGSEAAEISILAVLADRDFQYIWDRAFDLRISILAVLADRDRKTSRFVAPATISILAVLADRDRLRSADLQKAGYFNPRGPCGPRRTQQKQTNTTKKFQSLRSLRTATCCPGGPDTARTFQSSRSLRTATCRI